MLPRAVLFVMVGTVSEPLLDFPWIKAEMGIGARPILEALAEMDGESRRVAEAVLLRHEQRAAEGSKLNPGCREVLEWLNGRGMRTALITRNSRVSVETVLFRDILSFDALITREDASPKPNPAPLELACERLGVSAAEAWMVGDGQYDVEAGAAAGIKTVWVSHGRERPFAARPWRTVTGLGELLGLLAACGT
jgi:HAD superfamily hydrolase (TIGR01509 family)